MPFGNNCMSKQAKLHSKACEYLYTNRNVQHMMKLKVEQHIKLTMEQHMTLRVEQYMKLRMEQHMNT